MREATGRRGRLQRVGGSALRCLTATTGIALALNGASAWAREDNQADKAAVDEVGGESMIVVTAQRRTELSRDVPVTVTTASDVQLRAANVDSLLDLPKLAPGVRFDQQGAYTQPVIRGIGNTVALTQAGNSVGIYVDGFYIPNTLSIDFDFLNVKNVQVLKGPQGTLFGRNATAGAVLVQTAEPEFEVRGISEVSYGRFNELKAQGYITAPIADSVAFSLEGLYSRGDGFASNVYDGSLTSGGGFDPDARRKHPGRFEKWSLRGGLKVMLSDTAELLLRYEHIDKRDATGLMSSTLFGEVDGVTYPLSAGDSVPGTTFGRGRGNVALNQRADFRINSDVLQITGRLDLGLAELTSYSQYRNEQVEQFLDSDASSASILSLSLPERAEVFTQEFLLTSQDSGRLQYTAGLFFFSLKNDTQILFVQPGGSPLWFQQNGQKSRTYAAYADLTYELSSNLFVTGGLRYSRDEVRDPYQAAADFVPGNKFFAPDYTGQNLSPRAVIRYKPSDNSSVYASFTKGYKSAFADAGRTTGVDGYKDGYYVRPEDITAYEIGYKYADQFLSMELAGFWYDYKNLQNSYYLQGVAIYSNAAQSRIRGIEGAVSYRVTPAFQISAAGTYLDAKYRSYQNAGFFQPVIGPDVDGDGVGDFSGFDTSAQADASGLQAQRAPKFSATFSAQYTTNLADGELALSANLYHTSRIFFDAAHQFGQKGYDIVAARVQWTDPSDRYTFAVFGDNLFDERYLAQANVSLVGAGAVWGKPATYGISMRVKL